MGGGGGSSGFGGSGGGDKLNISLTNDYHLNFWNSPWSVWTLFNTYYLSGGNIGDVLGGLLSGGGNRGGGRLWLYAIKCTTFWNLMYKLRLC